MCYLDVGGSGLKGSRQSPQFNENCEPDEGGDEDHHHERTLPALVMKDTAPRQHSEDPSRECKGEKSPLRDTPSGSAGPMLVKSHEREPHGARKGEPAPDKLPERGHSPPARTGLPLKGERGDARPVNRETACSLLPGQTSGLGQKDDVGFRILDGRDL